MSYIHGYRRFFQWSAIFGVGPYWPRGHKLQATSAILFSNGFILAILAWKLLENSWQSGAHSAAKPTVTQVVNSLSQAASVGSVVASLSLHFYRHSLADKISTLNQLTCSFDFYDSSMRVFNYCLLSHVAWSLIYIVIVVSVDNGSKFIIYHCIFAVNDALTSSQFVVLIRLPQCIYRRMNRLLKLEAPSVAFLKEMINMDDLTKDYSDLIDSAFGYTNMMYTVQGFLYLTSVQLNLVDGFSHPIAIMYFLGLPFGIFSLMYLYCTEAVAKEAEQTAKYLHEIFIESDDPAIREEVEIFSLQLLHRKIEFTACGFFKLDFSLLYSMVGAVTTYIVVLMQFQSFQNGKNDCSVGNATAATILPSYVSSTPPTTIHPP